MAIPEKKKYKHNFLAQVICQITFEQVDSINEESLKIFKQKLGAEYAELATVRQQGIIIENDGSSIKSHTEDNSIWQIQSTDKSHLITITNTSFAITHSKYVKFSEYKVTIKLAQDLFIKQFSEIEAIQRLGLRYINQIAPEQLESGWDQYISKELTASLSFVDSSLLRRSMHSIVIQHEDEVKVNLNYGLFNQFFPAPIIKNEFIIDIDAFVDSPIDYEECQDLVSRLNTIIAIYFESSITEELRTLMGVLANG